MDFKFGKKNRNILLVVGFALGLMFFVSNGGLSVQKKATNLPTSMSDNAPQTKLNNVSLERSLAPLKAQEQVSEKVNSHLGISDKIKEIKEQNEKVRQILEASPMSSNNGIPRKQETIQVDLSPDANEKNAFNDLQKNKKDLNFVSPRNEILMRLADKQALKKMERAYNQEYVRQFIENARKDGVEIQLNQNNEIVSVKRIPSSFKANAINKPMTPRSHKDSQSDRSGAQ